MTMTNLNHTGMHTITLTEREIDFLLGLLEVTVFLPTKMHTPERKQAASALKNRLLGFKAREV